MKKVTLLCGMLLAVTASMASAAAGVNLRWSACFSDGGLSNRVFACAANTGSNVLVGSFEVGAEMANVSGNEYVIDFATASPVLPAWWQMRNPGTCRPNSLLFNTTISAVAVNCLDWSQGFAAGGIGAYIIGGVGGPNTSRVVAAAAVPVANLALLAPATDYFAFNLIINNLLTTGAGSCEGCLVPACIALNSINVVTPTPADNRKLSGPTNGTDSNIALWQGGGGVSTGRGDGCPAATPTKSATWGSVKSLYR